MSRKKKWVFRALAVFLALIGCEVALSLASKVSPRVAYFLSPPWERMKVPDDVLGHRMSPYYPGNDSWGFRNNKVPESCDVLTVGDSWTYGSGAWPEKCWPRQLEQMIGQSVYNASCGAYGPCEYNVLLDRCLTLKPKTVLLGLFLGNDMADVYNAVYVDDRFPEYRTKDSALSRAMVEADRVTTINHVVGNFWLAESGGQPVERSPAARLLEKSSLWCLVRSTVGGIRRQEISFLRGDDPPQIAFEFAARRPQRMGFDAVPALARFSLTPRSMSAESTWMTHASARGNGSPKPSSWRCNPAFAR